MQAIPGAAWRTHWEPTLQHLPLQRLQVPCSCFILAICALPEHGSKHDKTAMTRSCALLNERLDASRALFSYDCNGLVLIGCSSQSHCIECSLCMHVAFLQC